MNKEKCQKVENCERNKKNKDVGKNLDRKISAVTPEAQTQQQV